MPAPKARRSQRGRPSRRAARRAGPGQERILLAARTLISERGFHEVSARDIARRAQVDPALIYHYFADKDQVLLRALNLSFTVLPVEEGPAGPVLVGLGPRIVRRFLLTWGADRGHPLIHTVLRAATEDPRAAQQFREHIEREIIPATREHLGAEAASRSTLVGSVLLGLAVMRYILKVEPLASMTDRQVEERAGRLIDTILIGGAPPGTPVSGAPADDRSHKAT